MQLLNPHTLSQIDAQSVGRPSYDRDRLELGIVHLGIGAFMRAHLCVATEHAIASTNDLRWGIVGVSMQRPDTRDALAPQGGLYTVAQRGATTGQGGVRTHPFQVIGCVKQVLVAPKDPLAVVEAIASTSTRIVSLTVTEKGYTHDPATGKLRFDHPHIQHDMQRADAPQSAIGLIVRGLQRRQARGLSGITVMSLDNLASNGHVLQGAVLDFADCVDPSLALSAWIRSSCRFPCSMVDRIVPATTDADRVRVEHGLGLRDAWPVCAEPFFSWAVEDQFAAGRPAWTHPGMHFVSDAKPWETLKLRMVNGCHSVMAYAGQLAGWPTVDAAISQAPMRRFIEALMRAEIEPTLPRIEGVSLDAYRSELVARWINPDIAHKLAQIAMDGSQKIAPRWVTPIMERHARGESTAMLTLGVALWLHHLRGFNEAGVAYAINDPLADSLRALHARAVQAATPIERAQVMLGFEPVFGALAASKPVVAEVASHWQSLERQGVSATLEACATRFVESSHRS